LSEVTKAKRGHPSPMMFVSIGIGAVLAIALISVVSALTGGKVTSGSTQIPSALQGKTIAHFSESGLYGGTEKAPWEDHHPSVLVFFASWCTVCQPEIPKVATYVSTHNLGGVVVLGIDANDTRSAAQAFVKKDRVKFPVAFDPNTTVTAGLFDFGTLPETVFLNAKGVVQSVHFGRIPIAQFAAGIQHLRA